MAGSAETRRLPASMGTAAAGSCRRDQWMRRSSAASFEDVVARNLGIAALEAVFPEDVLERQRNSAERS